MRLAVCICSKEKIVELCKCIALWSFLFHFVVKQYLLAMLLVSVTEKLFLKSWKLVTSFDVFSIFCFEFTVNNNINCTINLQ